MSRSANAVQKLSTKEKAKEEERRSYVVFDWHIKRQIGTMTKQEKERERHPETLIEIEWRR